MVPLLPPEPAGPPPVPPQAASIGAVTAPAPIIRKRFRLFSWFIVLLLIVLPCSDTVRPDDRAAARARRSGVSGAWYGVSGAHRRTLAWAGRVPSCLLHTDHLECTDRGHLDEVIVAVGAHRAVGVGDECAGVHRPSARHANSDPVDRQGGADAVSAHPAQVHQVQDVIALGGAMDDLD